MNWFKKDIVIRMMEYLNSKPERKALKKDFKEKFNNPVKENITEMLNNPKFFYSTEYNYGKPEAYYKLNTEGYFKLLDYKQLVITRRTSLIAISIAIISIIVNIVITIK